jgi:hypothetical protein
VARNFIRKSSDLKEQEDFRMAVTADYSLGESGGPIVNDGSLIKMMWFWKSICFEKVLWYTRLTLNLGLR